MSQDHVGSTAVTKQWQTVESTLSCNFPCVFKIFLFPMCLIIFLSQKSSGTGGPLSDEVAAVSEQASSIHCGYRNYMPSNRHSDGSCFLTFRLSISYVPCFILVVPVFEEKFCLDGCSFQMAILCFYFLCSCAYGVG